ncbi:MAG: hypothetical protein KGS09_21120 [Nitrospirae bacterium]|nr:hypothetical protein [Nitrospirota bacterium]MDE3041650.1 hypothetical protein [Nitrospirota bacterium]MDE3050718.1 hypothetical protein [Nitrospirota bacterium]
MADWGQEEDRATWFDLAQEIRQRHERCLGPQPMLVSERDGYVPPHVFFFRTVTEVYTVPYLIDHRAPVLELLVGWARERGAFAIGTVFQGVSSEKEGGKIHLRPTILSSLRGVGRFEGWILEVNQRIDRDGSDLVLQTPLVRRVGPNTSGTEWEAELGSGDVLRGPWPKRLPLWSVSAAKR